MTRTWQWEQMSQLWTAGGWVGEESDSQTIQEAALILTSLGCGLRASRGGRGRGGVGSFAIVLEHTGFDD